MPSPPPRRLCEAWLGSYSQVICLRYQTRTLLSFSFSLFSYTTIQLTTQDDKYDRSVYLLCIVRHGQGLGPVHSAQDPWQQQPRLRPYPPSAIIKRSSPFRPQALRLHSTAPATRRVARRFHKQTWHIDIVSVAADVENHSAVVRAVFHMQAKNDAEVIENEILFWCQMDESGRKVVESTEFVDPTALMALKPKLEAAKAAEATK
jgi:hypothetical protein